MYDRREASITRITLDEIPEEAYTTTRIFHTSGISLALCEQMRDVAIELIRRFKAGGAMISFDVNSVSYTHLDVYKRQVYDAALL